VNNFYYICNMKYDNFRYIYPCRPQNAVTPDDLTFWDRSNSLFAQLKFNGSNSLIFTNGDFLRVMGRHGQILTNMQLKKDEVIENLYNSLNLNGGWLVLNGEYLNKNKKDERGISFNHKFILFDILVYDSEYLVGKTFDERIELLYSLYGKNNSEKDFLYGISDNIYMAKTYYSDFKSIFDHYTRIELIEGLVMKRKNAKLEIANSEKNNWRSQLKCRKPEKNYRY
jgi:hypothetical protein